MAVLGAISRASEDWVANHRVGVCGLAETGLFVSLTYLRDQREVASIPHGESKDWTWGYCIL